jgi:hypothetical protein
MPGPKACPKRYATRCKMLYHYRMLCHANMLCQHGPTFPKDLAPPVEASKARLRALNQLQVTTKDLYIKLRKEEKWA